MTLIMEQIKIFTNSVVSDLLSNDGLTATGNATKVLNDIKCAASELGVYITYFSGEKVSFTYIYQNTFKVPAKALKSLEAFKLWNWHKINKVRHDDLKRCGLIQ